MYVDWPPVLPGTVLYVVDPAGSLTVVSVFWPWTPDGLVVDDLRSRDIQNLSAIPDRQSQAYRDSPI